MKRSDFLKIVTLGTVGLLMPKATQGKEQAIKPKTSSTPSCLKNSYIQGRDGRGEALFTLDTENDIIIANLDGYAIIPVEEFNGDMRKTISNIRRHCLHEHKEV